MKTKKSGLLVILAFVMVLALSCSVWAITGRVTAESVHQDVADNIETTLAGSDGYGLYAFRGGTISNDGYYIRTSGDQAHAAYANASKIDTSGDITTSGVNADGAFASNQSTVNVYGTITTTNERSRGVEANNSTLTMNGSIATSGKDAYGAFATAGAVISINGTITTLGNEAYGVYAYNGSSVSMNGDIETSGSFAHGAYANQDSDVTITGDIVANGLDTYGLQGENNGTVTMNNGTLTIIDESSSGIRLEKGSTANLTSVDVVAETLLVSTTTGTLNAEDSALAGDVLHGGIGGAAETLEINLNDTTLEGAILTSPGIGNQSGGVVDVTLENSDWVVTGDSNTNGKVTGDADSAIDYTEAPEGTVVTIDELAGELAITLKPGDGINITNSTGNNGNFSSSNPDVLEVVTDSNGAVTIISKGEGDADLTYDYKDENGNTQTVTVDGSSSDPNGTGSKPDTTTSSSGSSSGCNAGFGIFALLGLAFVAKKK